jgi:hypothetical protein
MWEVPLRFKLFVTPKQKALSFNFLKQIELNFGLTFSLESKVELQTNYHLKTKTTLKSYSWEREPELSFGKFHFSLTNALGKQIEDHKGELILKLDSMIAEKVNLKSTMEKIWMKLQTPKLVEKELGLFWLFIKPQQISATQPLFSNNQIKIPINLLAHMQIEGIQQLTDSVRLPLPDLTLEKSQKRAFEINLLGKLPFSLLNQRWKELIPTTTFQIQGEELTLDSLRFFPMGEKLGIEVHTRGVTEATVVFSGKPIIDEQDWVLRISDFNYEMTESDLLAQGAELLYGEEFKKLITQLLYFPLKTQLMILPTLLEDGLNKGEKADKRVFSIQEMDFEPHSPILTEDILYLELKATGKANLKVQAIN